jgi:SMI1-KNR4 cell-wall
VTDFDELFSIIAPRDPPPPPVDWAAAEARLGAAFPVDYKTLVDCYGSASLGGLVLLVPDHPDENIELFRESERLRSALQYLIDEGLEQPYGPQELQPWATDESGNVVYWKINEDGWPVLAHEVRGPGWERYDEGAVALLTGLLSGRVESEFLVVDAEAGVEFFD